MGENKANRTFLLLVFPGLSWSPAMESLKNCKGVVFILETEQEKLPGRAYSSGTLKCSPMCIVGGKQMLFPGPQAVESPTQTCNSYHGPSTHHAILFHMLSSSIFSLLPTLLKLRESNNMPKVPQKWWWWVWMKSLWFQCPGSFSSARGSPLVWWEVFTLRTGLVRWSSEG